MRDYISIDVLANWVTMLRADVEGAICLSDDGDEARFYERCTNQVARVVPVPEAAFSLLARIESEGIRGVVATSRGIQPSPSASNVFQPSLGDVASVLLFAKSSAAAISEICGNVWLKACEKEVGPVCHRAAWIARVLQLLREQCKKEGVNLANLLELSEVVDWNSFELSWDRLGPSLTEKGLSRDALEGLPSIRASEDIRNDLRECDGMEAVGLVALATGKYRPRGIVALKKVETSLLIGMLRVAFDLSELEKDEVFWKMRRWERENVRYQLLREWRILDPLGVVWDQRYWEADLSAMIETLGVNQHVAVFEIDLDNFGQINKKLSHSHGDQAIRTHCAIVKGTLGAVGEVYRRGGDEVLVIAAGIDEQLARELAEKTRAQVQEVFRNWASKHKLNPAPTASIGIALAAPGESPSEVIRRVDEAQQQAKQQGKNRVVLVQ